MLTAASGAVTLLANQSGLESAIARIVIPKGWVYQFAPEYPSVVRVAAMVTTTTDGSGNATLTGLAEPCSRWQTAGSLGESDRLDIGNATHPGLVVAGYKSGPTLSQCTAINYTTKVATFADASTQLYIHYLIGGGALLVKAYAPGNIEFGEDQIAALPLDTLAAMDTIGGDRGGHALFFFDPDAWFVEGFVIEFRVDLSANIDTGYSESTYGTRLTTFEIPMWVTPIKEFAASLGVPEEELLEYRIEMVQP
jgi:hypothetical protein